MRSTFCLSANFSAVQQGWTRHHKQQPISCSGEFKLSSLVTAAPKSPAPVRRDLSTLYLAEHTATLINHGPSDRRDADGHSTATMRHLLLFLTSFLSLLIPQISASAPASASSSASGYYEQLVLRPLPLSALLASFNFRSNTSLSEFEAHNFRFFPRSLGQILQYAGTKELHLRFSLGRWDAQSWGARPWDGSKEGGTGVEIWAWLEADSDEEYD